MQTTRAPCPYARAAALEGMTSADLIAFAARLADAAGEAIRPHFRTPFGVESKADDSPVTIADRAAEAAMRRIIEAERPGDGIVGEEYGNVREGADRIWVLDPIDGTRSFITGRAIFGTLIALIEDGVPVLGVIDQPILGERWIGVRGQPTLFNGSPCRTRACGSISSALIATTSPYLFGDDERPRFEKVMHASASLALGGDCYSYALLSSGHVDLVIEAGLKLYDFAALVPVVEGAGGRMTDWTGAALNAGSSGQVIATGDPALADQVLSLIN